MNQTSGDGSRCPKCAALLRPDAQWCGLCYADLRPTPAVAAAPAAVVTAPAAAPVLGDAVPAAAPAQGRHARPGRHAAPDPLADVTEPIVDGGATDTRHGSPARAGTTWPCLACGTAVRLDEATCPHCGAPFLSGALEADDDKVSRLTTTRSKVVIMVGGSLGLMGIFLLLMYIFGTVF